MKIKLFADQNQEVSIDLNKIENKIKELKRLLLLQKQEKTPNITENIYSKRLVENIMLLLNDLGYSATFKEIQNIISKKNPNNSMSKFVVNLHEGLSIFWQKNKIIHQNNVFMLHKIVNNQDEALPFASSPFRTKNNVSYNNINFNLKVSDYNKIPTFFEQLVNFINNDHQLSSFVNMQIVHIHNLAISPFAENNVLFSKILSIWYLTVYDQEKEWDNLPINDYLNVYQLNADKYTDIVKNCLLTSDYTDFIEFTVENMTKLQMDKILINQINLFLRKDKRIYLAEYEKKFLSVIIFYQMDEFDWKFFKHKTQWPASKQYIIRNLNKLEQYSLLFSKKLKNRKFFYRSRLLKNIIKNFWQDNHFNLEDQKY